MAAIIIILLLLIWIVWLTSKPSRSALVGEAERKQLDELQQKDTATGNHLLIYADFHPMVEQLLSDIGSAQQFIHLQFFKFEADAIGQCIGDALVQKAKEGVEVRLMYDDLTNHKSRWYYSKLRQQGVEVRGFGPARIPFLRKKDNYRNHRKVVVVDGKIGYIGGMNIADRYYQGLRWGNWRDTQIRIEGPAVAQLQHSFLCDWRYATGQLLARKDYFPTVAPKGDTPARVLTSGPIGDGPAIMAEFCRILDESRQYVYWDSPYFIPTKAVMQSLCNAARRGVDVRITIPPRGDRGILTPLASKSYMQEALEAGVHFYFYGKGYMHSKIMACDDRTATVGSTNIDPRSFLLDLEINLVVEDRAFTREIKEICLADEKDSECITMEKWQQRPILQRVMERMARIFSAQL